MRRITLVTLGFIGAAAAGATWTPAPKWMSNWMFAASTTARDRSEIVDIKPGAPAKMANTIKGYQAVTYGFGAKEGQTMSVLFRPSNARCHFSVFAPGSEKAVFNGSRGGNEFASTLTAAGIYRTQVYMLRKAAQRGEQCKYAITFKLTR